MDGWTGLDWMDWILLRKLVLLEHLAMLINIILGGSSRLGKNPKFRRKKGLKAPLSTYLVIKMITFKVIYYAPKTKFVHE